jgi:hypothetical protein
MGCWGKLFTIVEPWLDKKATSYALVKARASIDPMVEESDGGAILDLQIESHQDSAECCRNRLTIF